MDTYNYKIIIIINCNANVWYLYFWLCGYEKMFCLIRSRNKNSHDSYEPQVSNCDDDDANDDDDDDASTVCGLSY